MAPQHTPTLKWLIYTREDVSSMPSFSLDNIVPMLGDVDITPAIVLGKLKNINVNNHQDLMVGLHCH